MGSAVNQLLKARRAGKLCVVLMAVGVLLAACGSGSTATSQGHPTGGRSQTSASTAASSSNGQPDPKLVTSDPLAWVNSKYSQIAQCLNQMNPGLCNGIWKTGSPAENQAKQAALQPGGGFTYQINSVQVRLASSDLIILMVQGVLNGNQPIDDDDHVVIQNGAWVIEGTLAPATPTS